MKIFEISLTVILVSLLCSNVFPQEMDSAAAYKLRITHGNFKKIEAFGIIRVYILGSGKEIGLSENDLTDYVKFKFKNNFIGIKILNSEKLGKLCGEEAKKAGKGKLKLADLFYCSSEKIGYILFKVNTLNMYTLKFHTAGVGDPVAVHVNFKVGHIKDMPILEGGLEASPVLWENSVLHYCSKNEITNDIRQILNMFIENLALDFFKARGEL